MKDKYEVSSKFILDAYKAACGSWKIEIEKQVPELFSDTFRKGEKVMVEGQDSSYIITTFSAEGRKMAALVNTQNIGITYNGAWYVKDHDFIRSEELGLSGKIFRIYRP